MKSLRLGVLLLLLVAVHSGCLGLGPDPRAPHRLIVHNYESFPVAGNITVSQGGVVLLARPIELAPATALEESFGPASDGAYEVSVTRAHGGPATTNETMGRGGYALFVTFSENGVQFSTLHGD